MHCRHHGPARPHSTAPRGRALPRACPHAQPRTAFMARRQRARANTRAMGAPHAHCDDEIGNVPLYWGLEDGCLSLFLHIIFGFKLWLGQISKYLFYIFGFRLFGTIDALFSCDVSHDFFSRSSEEVTNIFNTAFGHRESIDLVSATRLFFCWAPFFLSFFFRHLLFRLALATSRAFEARMRF